MSPVKKYIHMNFLCDENRYPDCCPSCAQQGVSLLSAVVTKMFKFEQQYEICAVLGFHAA